MKSVFMLRLRRKLRKPSAQHQNKTPTGFFYKAHDILLSVGTHPAAACGLGQSEQPLKASLFKLNRYLNDFSAGVKLFFQIIRLAFQSYFYLPADNSLIPVLYIKKSSSRPGKSSTCNIFSISHCGSQGKNNPVDCFCRELLPHNHSLAHQPHNRNQVTHLQTPPGTRPVPQAPAPVPPHREYAQFAYRYRPY